MLFYFFFWAHHVEKRKLLFNFIKFLNFLHKYIQTYSKKIFLSNKTFYERTLGDRGWSLKNKYLSCKFDFRIN